MATKKQYYKVIDTKDGHHGYKYKMGINTDPHPVPLDQIGSCDAGALYFTDKENLADFRNFGTHIAWVTPISEVKDDFKKYKAHTIKITKILPMEKALPLIFKGEGLYDAFDNFCLNVPVEVIEGLSVAKRMDYIMEMFSDSEIEKYLKSKDGDSAFTKSLKRLYKRRKDGLYQDYRIVAFLLRNGMSYKEVLTADLQEILYMSRQTSHHKTLKKFMPEDVYKVAYRLANL